MIYNVTEKFRQSIPLPKQSKNYLFVMPVMTADDMMQYQFPSGFGSVVSALKASGRNVSTLNLNYKENVRETVAAALENIDVLCTGGLNGQYVSIRQVIDIAREVNKNLTIVLGGGGNNRRPHCFYVRV